MDVSWILHTSYMDRTYTLHTSYIHVTYFLHTRYILLHTRYILLTCTLHTSTCILHTSYIHVTYFYINLTYFVHTRYILRTCKLRTSYRERCMHIDSGKRRVMGREAPRLCCSRQLVSTARAPVLSLLYIAFRVALSLIFPPITKAVAAQIPSSSSSPYRGRAAGPLFGTSTLSSSNRRWCEARSPRDRSHSHLPKQTWTRSSLACASTARWTDPATS